MVFTYSEVRPATFKAEKKNIVINLMNMNREKDDYDVLQTARLTI